MVLYTRKNKTPFQVDESDIETVSYYTWHISTDGYPATNIRVAGKQTYVRLHLFLLGSAPVGLEWDHENRDKTDCRRFNLRAVTSTVNKRNTGLRKDSSSGVKGVSWSARYNSWDVRIRANKERIRVGGFSSIVEAEAVRKNLEEQLWNGLSF